VFSNRKNVARPYHEMLPTKAHFEKALKGVNRTIVTTIPPRDPTLPWVTSDFRDTYNNAAIAFGLRTKTKKAFERLRRKGNLDPWWKIAMRKWQGEKRFRRDTRKAYKALKSIGMPQGTLREFRARRSRPGADGPHGPGG
jgi:hypothetical protein